MLNKNSKPLQCFFVQAAFTTAFTYLTSGVFLSGFAIYLGAGDVLVSYLSVIVNICGVMILGFSSFLERFLSRKKLALALTALSRLATLLIVLIPALAPEKLRIVLFVPLVIAAFTLQAQTTVVLNQWMMGFMDGKKSGRYISVRQTLTLVVTVTLSVAGGRWMDFMQGQYIGFVVVFGAAAVSGICEIAVLAAAPDLAAAKTAASGSGLRGILQPFKNKPFIEFVLYVLLFYLLLYLSDSFTMVYMMKYLALPYSTVTVLSMVISLPQVLLLSIWGKISDRRGHSFVLRASVWLFSGETLLMAFSGPDTWYIFIPAAFLLSSAANAGFAIAVFNRRYELMPKENRIVFDNFYTAAIGLGFILGPMIGGGVKSLLESVPALDAAVTFAGIRFLYLISTLGLVLLQLFTILRKVQSQEPEYQASRAED